MMNRNNQEPWLIPGLLCGSQEYTCLDLHLWPPIVCISMKRNLELKWGIEPRHSSKGARMAKLPVKPHSFQANVLFVLEVNICSNHPWDFLTQIHSYINVPALKCPIHYSANVWLLFTSKFEIDSHFNTAHSNVFRSNLLFFIFY